MDRILAWLLPLALLAGCTEAGDVGADASVDFDGSGDGDHSDTADCDDEGTLTGTGTVDDGNLTVRVTDGDGDVVFEESFDGEVAVEAEIVEGASGEWRLEASRASDDVLGDEFRGGYVFRLDC